MSIQIGDVVEVGSHRVKWRWVVAEEVGNPQGEPKLVRIMRKRGSHGMTSHLIHPHNLTLIDRPAFALGEAVTVNGLPGEVIEAGPQVRILLAPYKRTLSGGETITYTGNIAVMPGWQLILENRDLT